MDAGDGPLQPQVSLQMRVLWLLSMLLEQRQHTTATHNKRQPERKAVADL